jgi:hypothetical protein
MSARRFIKDNSLSLFFGFIFVLALGGQAVAGHAQLNNELRADGFGPVSFGRYVTSSAFAADVVENWQSEYLQFLLYVVVTVWLIQRGSSESKEPGKEGRESDEQQKVGRHARADSPPWARVGGWRTKLYSNSLAMVMGAAFVASWVAQSVAGMSAYNEEQLRQLQDPVSWSAYIGSAEFWNRSLQNWQSELLAVLSMVVLSIYLRQRGSPESKPVGASHLATGVEG